MSAVEKATVEQQIVPKLVGRILAGMGSRNAFAKIGLGLIDE
jgi:hypothetical protein